MTRYQFPGFPAFLDAAASELGRPESAGPARRNATLAAVATLCAQAAEAEGRHVAGILAKAQEMVDQLGAAHRASELMLDDVRVGRSMPATCPPARRPRSCATPNPCRGVKMPS